MKLLVVPDIHQKVGLLNNILLHENTADHTIFLGDYFDDFDDNFAEVATMAEWLKENLYKNPAKRTFLLGNHDFQYMMPIGTVYCSGYAQWKHEIIDKILKKEDWEKFKYFHAIDNYWFSHAGITEYWFAHPLYGVTLDNILKVVEDVKHSVIARNGDYGPVWAADKYRGGRHKKGGLLWNDLRNSEHFEGITQVMGHTPSKWPFATTNDSIRAKNVFLDTHLLYYCVIDTQTHEITFLENKYE